VCDAANRSYTQAVRGLVRIAVGFCFLVFSQCDGSSDSPVTNGCAKDSDCKGDRICENGVCVAPEGGSDAAGSGGSHGGSTGSGGATTDAAGTGGSSTGGASTGGVGGNATDSGSSGGVGGTGGENDAAGDGGLDCMGLECAPLICGAEGGGTSCLWVGTYFGTCVQVGEPCTCDASSVSACLFNGVGSAVATCNSQGIAITAGCPRGCTSSPWGTCL
jgi:hypothetical protein